MSERRNFETEYGRVKKRKNIKYTSGNEKVKTRIKLQKQKMVKNKE